MTQPAMLNININFTNEDDRGGGGGGGGGGRVFISLC